MSLRTAILTAALPSLASTSFTRAALSNALRTLPSHAALSRDAREGVIDTVFGPGIEGPVALVSAWEEEGARVASAATSTSTSTTTSSPSSPTDRLTRVLSARLAHSAALGAHLTEAHALLVSSTAASVPLPAAVLAALRARLPSVPLYKPLPAAVASKAWEHGSAAATSLLDRTGGRLPLPPANPAAPLAYAWRIADEAVYAARPHAGTGVMREPRGAGVEWYTSRVAVAAAYLSAEAHLLQPYPAQLTHLDDVTLDAAGAALADADAAAPSTSTSTSTNPHLPAALSSLRHNLRRLEDLRGVATSVENAADSAISLLELMTRSVAGIVRSRGF